MQIGICLHFVSVTRAPGLQSGLVCLGIGLICYGNQRAMGTRSRSQGLRNCKLVHTELLVDGWPIHYSISEWIDEPTLHQLVCNLLAN